MKPILTPRESEVALLISLGGLQKEVADRLCISPYTVDVHVRHILEKTGCRNSVELTNWMYKQKHGVTLGISPFKRILIGALFFGLVIAGMINEYQELLRPARVKAQTSRKPTGRTGARRSRTKEFQL